MRSLVRVLLLVVLLAIVGFFAFGWWSGAVGHRPGLPTRAPTGTTGTIDTSAARERGAEFGDRAARAAATVEETVEEAAITSKIKAKMALDDSVRARSIDVSTHGSTVTVSGTVRSTAERERALRLAQETAGVTRVVDRLDVQR